MSTLEVTTDEAMGGIRHVFEVVGLDPADAVPHIRPKEDLGLDSVDMVDVIVALERRFGVRLQDFEAKECATLGELAALIVEQTGG